jgi:hypothetical protein
VSDTIDCEEHGTGPANGICVHLLESLADETPRGFVWNTDEDGEYSALCSDCDTMSDERWEAERADLWVVVCFKCFLRAARLNGVSLPGIH